VRHSLLALGLLAGLAACGEREVPLTGERLSLDGSTLTAGATANDVVAFNAPAAVANSSWSHVGGSATHQIAHPALGASLSPAWSTDIGAGNGKRQRITAEPVSANGLVFAMDASAQVSAVTPAGGVAWTTSLIPSTEATTGVPGGGLAVSGDTLFATDGYGFLTALDASTGATRWRQDLDAVAGAPTVAGDIVYVTTRDGTGWAIDRVGGRVLWTLASAPSGSNLVGGPGPAVTERLALFPFGSGEVVATFREGGFRRWASTVSGTRTGRVFSQITDISGDPVVSGNTVYVGNQSGRTVALDLGTGERRWTAREGAFGGPVWVDGGSVFLLSDVNSLVRLDAATGNTIWSRELPFFESDRERRQKTIFAHYGPVLAGGLLRVASSDGLLRSFNPETGTQIGSVALPGGAASAPIVVNNTLYVLGGDGELHAFR